MIHMSHPMPEGLAVFKLALYDELNRVGKAKGWSLICWITAENNYQARASYDKIAEKLSG